MTSPFPNVSISTERLVLRPLDEDDVPALAEMMNDELVGAWTDVPQPFTEEGARTWITAVFVGLTVAAAVVPAFVPGAGLARGAAHQNAADALLLPPSAMAGFRVLAPAPAGARQAAAFRPCASSAADCGVVD